MERLFQASPSYRRNFIDRLVFSTKNNYNSLINKYNDLNKQTKQSYPINKIATPTNTDYKTGIIPRYFTRKANRSILKQV